MKKREKNETFQKDFNLQKAFGFLNSTLNSPHSTL